MAFGQQQTGMLFASRNAMTRQTLAPTVILGRMAAACVHPLAAWRVSMSWRVLALAAYSAAGYVIVLSALLVLS